MLMFKKFCLCNLKCYPYNTHHPTQIYCALLVGKFNRFNTYRLIQTTHTNHTYDSIIRIIHIYDTVSRYIIYPYLCILVLLVYYFIQIHYIQTHPNQNNHSFSLPLYVQENFFVTNLSLTSCFVGKSFEGYVCIIFSLVYYFYLMIFQFIVLAGQILNLSGSLIKYKNMEA